jgi:hypothetical protein
VVYSTCVFNHPRVTLELDSSYLEPTEDFVNAINNALQHASTTRIELEKVLSKYGHVYPQRVLLGGHLYHTEEHCVSGSADEYKKRISAESRFKAAYFKQAEIHVGGGTEKRSQEEWSQQDSAVTFQAVGGDTLRCRDPTLWAQSVGDPNWWRIIEEHDYQSVLTLLSEQQQALISKSLVL